MLLWHIQTEFRLKPCMNHVSLTIQIRSPQSEPFVWTGKFCQTNQHSILLQRWARIRSKEGYNIHTYIALYPGLPSLPLRSLVTHVTKLCCEVEARGGLGTRLHTYTYINCHYVPVPSYHFQLCKASYLLWTHAIFLLRIWWIRWNKRDLSYTTPV